jgi:hypothetical protein
VNVNEWRLVIVNAHDRAHSAHPLGQATPARVTALLVNAQHHPALLG